MMDAAESIQAEIQNELKNIIQILGLIQSELDELNTLSKPEGPLDVAVKEGLGSMNTLTKMDGFLLKNEVENLMQLSSNNTQEEKMKENDVTVE